MVTEKEIWNYLEEVFDPEIPVLTVVDLGVIRSVELIDDKCKVVITPTYSGCPAMKLIEEEIIAKLNLHYKFIFIFLQRKSVFRGTNVPLFVDR